MKEIQKVVGDTLTRARDSVIGASDGGTQPPPIKVGKKVVKGIEHSGHDNMVSFVKASPISFQRVVNIQDVKEYRQVCRSLCETVALHPMIDVTTECSEHYFYLHASFNLSLLATFMLLTVPHIGCSLH